MTAAEVRENMVVALDNLLAHRVRSLLTVLGIVIGVTSVISVAAIIEGLNLFIQDKVAALGSRTYFVARFGGGTDPQRMPERMRVRKYFQYTDAAYLREHAPLVSGITTFGTSAFFFGTANEVRYADRVVERVIIRGVEPEYTNAVPAFNVEAGRFISRYDLEHVRPVAVIGHDIAESLFKDEQPIGKVLRLNGRIYEVIGVFERYPGLFGAPGVDDFVIIPLSDFKKNYPNDRELILAFSVPATVNVDTAKDQVVDALRRLRRVPHRAENDFEVIAPDFLADLWDQLTGALVILTGVISSMGLLVGGIGVMNIMLISVTERTQEIGIRKAIGARRSDIRVQFLLEAITVTLLGGVLGILAGWLIAFGIRTAIPSIPATVSLIWVALGVAMSVATGVFFGFYPANRAAYLDPIVSLRYE